MTTREYIALQVYIFARQTHFRIKYDMDLRELINELYTRTN